MAEFLVSDSVALDDPLSSSFDGQPLSKLLTVGGITFETAETNIYPNLSDDSDQLLVFFHAMSCF